ncbi:MAG: hypothetical protein RI940_1271 [Bacteroidota bacterium]|jgi:hypothetical protein
MLKQILFSFFLLVTFKFSNGQISADSTGISLQKLAIQIIEDSNIDNRYIADSIFTRSFVKTLNTPYSFNYTFDSLKTVSQIISPDKKFKIFSWQLKLNDDTCLQRAALQMNTPDGKLKLLPFFDRSETFDAPEIEICNRKKWMGAIYYDIVLTENNNTKFYTLLGFDDFNNFTSRKVIEVIRFEKDEPIFGGNYFTYPKDETYPDAPVERFVYYYKKGSNAYIKYNSESKQIILSELSSTNNDLKMKSTLVPTGNEVFFTWKNGKWVMPETETEQ